MRGKVSALAHPHARQGSGWRDPPYLQRPHIGRET